MDTVKSFSKIVFWNFHQPNTCYTMNSLFFQNTTELNTPKELENYKTQLIDFI